MAEGAVRVVDRDEPAERPETLQQPGTHADDRPAQKPGRIDQMAAVGEQVSTASDPPWARPPAGAPGAVHRDRLEVVGHRVAIDRVVVPGLERDPPAHLLADEPSGEVDARVEPAVVADLDDQPARRRPIAQLAARLDGRPQRLLDQDVLSGLERLARRADVELVGDRDDHRLDVGIGQHGVIVAIRDARPVDGRHPLSEVVGDVADRVQLGVACLADGVEMGRLRDRAAAQHADPQTTGLLDDHDFPGPRGLGVPRGRPISLSPRIQRGRRICIWLACSDRRGVFSRVDRIVDESYSPRLR